MGRGAKQPKNHEYMKFLKKIGFKMAWNEPGGNKNQDPWGNRGNDQGPPDLDEVFRKLRDKFAGLFGGKPSSPRSQIPTGGAGIGIGLIVFIIFMLWMATGFYKLEDAERGIVLRFGKHVETTQKGLHWHIPRPIENVEKVNVAERHQFPVKATMLTQDENIVDIEATVQYQITEGEKFLFNVRNPQLSISQATESALRQVIGKTKMDFVMTEGRSVIAADIKTITQEIADSYAMGLTVVEVNLQEANPPAEVRDAFQDVTQAREDQVRLINEAEAYRNEILPKARGHAARLREEADGYKQEVTARADGEAQRFAKLLTEYNKAPDVTRDRIYLDTVESVLSNTTKVMVDIKGNNIMYLPLDKMLGNTTGTGSMVPAQIPSSGIPDAAPVRDDARSRDARTREVR
jgi:modulator of FtsH protease HflK